jgi:tetratricopeptide (TPR) repeat protein
LNNQIQPAIQHFEKALEIAKERGDREAKIRAYRGLGNAYRSNDQIQQAFQLYENALEIAKERG